jgi:glutamate-1-semialdehyde aminotransferase/spore coat polysaccharide biosynthesis protein SpsF (cytidylyltransferase family)
MILAIIQARMSSTRLPGKVLQEIAGQPMLWHVVRRTEKSALVDKVVVATSVDAADEAIAAFCEREKIACFRGDLSDVLDRFYQAARAFLPDAIVRITADCPLMDGAVVDRVIGKFEAENADYASNTFIYTFPDGLDVEVFTFAALEDAWKNAKKLTEREHVTPYIRLNSKLKVASVVSEDLRGKGMRWTVDEPADLRFVQEIYRRFPENGFFGWREALAVIEENPELLEINQKAIMNEGYYKTLFAQSEAGAAPKLKLDKSLAMLDRAKNLIPGASQTFSKGYTQFVQGAAPVFLQRGAGAHVWDVDGNEYIDYIQGLLPNILGYANEEVNRAAFEQLQEGHSFSLPHPVEVQLAEKLTEIIPCAEMVRFGKNGSDATAGAVRAARAFTGRERVACCGYHGWQDWFIGSTTRNAGVPQGVRDLTHPFAYNNLESLENLLETHKGEFAAVIMEPVNFVEPEDSFLQDVKELAHKHGALLIFDEICSGFHFGIGGAQKKYNVVPDMACFGKAMGNGFPIACVVGRRDVMKTFGEIFFSFTFGGEVASMAAALKVLEILEQTDALTRMNENGKRLQDGFNALAKEAGLSERFECIASPVWSLIKFRDAEGKDSYLERSLFSQEVIKRGVLMLVTHNMTAAHDAVTTERTLEVYAAVFKTLSNWLSDSNPAKYLEGEMIQPVFKVR